jgi:hypothetical protein
MNIRLRIEHLAFDGSPVMRRSGTAIIAWRIANATRDANRAIDFRGSR